MAKKTILVAGALGLIGRTLIEHCETLPDVELIGIGRRKPDFPSRAHFVSVDLLDRADCEQKLSSLSAITHILYAAWIPAATRGEEVASNLAMLRNLMETLEPRAQALRHVTLLQGGKAYGSHLGNFMTPAIETDPRHMPPNFYYDQEDYLAALQKRAGWAWTIFRPTVVYGLAYGNPMNMTTVIAVYAAISKELGLPLRFPGSDKAYRTLCQGVDAGLIARAILWAGDSEAARNQIYNITNGDLFRWSRMWPHIAKLFDLAVAEPQPIPLVEYMSAHEPLWNAMVRRHNLRPISYRDAAAWPFGEFILKREFDHVLDTTKLRAHGFDGFEDTYRMFERQIVRLREDAMIPQ
jgi:nucleoside-diphosphate-sugar epimerase